MDRDSMIERYLEGTMAPHERAEFAQMMQSDASLRTSVEAENLIRSAVRNDQRSAGSGQAASRDRFMAMLATVSTEFAQPGSGGPSNTPTNATPGPNPIGSASSSASGFGSFLPWLGGCVAVVVAAIFVIPKLAPNESPRPVAVPAASAPAQLPPAAVVPPSPQPIATQPATETREQSAGARATEQPAATERSAESSRRERQRSGVTNMAARPNGAGTARQRAAAPRTAQPDRRNNQASGTLHQRLPVFNQAK